MSMAAIFRFGTNINRSRMSILVVVLALTLIPLLTSASKTQAQPTLPGSQNPAHKYGDLPLSFVPNLGQTDAAVHFQVNSAGGSLFFTPSEIVLSLSSATRRDEQNRVSTA